MLDGNVHQITQLDSGLRVVTEHVPGSHSASLGVWIATGSRHEHDLQRGYAHFVEHMLFKGNDRLDAEQISRWFDAIGSDVNAATSREYTVVHTRVVENKLERSLAVLGEMVGRPAFAVEDVSAEREVILEEIAMYEDSPSDVVHEIADGLVFAGSTLGLPILGTESSITNAAADDLRSFHKDAYSPERLIVSGAGAVDHGDFVDMVRKSFAHTPDKSAGPTQRTTSAIAPHEVCAEYFQKETEQVHLVLSGRGPERGAEERHAMAVLDLIFGSTPSSRLFMEIRERRGLAYSVYSFHSSYHTVGQTGVYVGIRPDRVEEVLEVTNAQLQKIVSDAPSTEELELAKGHLEGRMMLAMESSTARGNRLGSSLVTETPIYSINEILENIRAVSAEQVWELARTVFTPGALSVAAVADDVDAVKRALANTGFCSQERRS